MLPQLPVILLRFATATLTYPSIYVVALNKLQSSIARVVAIVCRNAALAAACVAIKISIRFRWISGTLHLTRRTRRKPRVVITSCRHRCSRQGFRSGTCTCYSLSFSFALLLFISLACFLGCLPAEVPLPKGTRLFSAQLSHCQCDFKFRGFTITRVRHRWLHSPVCFFCGCHK